MDTWLIHTLNGVSFGMQLFLIAAGLSLIFGMMRILNLAHGSFYILGAYIAISVFGAVGNFWLALLAGSAALAVFGVLMQRFLMHRFIHDELSQVLLTFGFLFIIQDFTLWIWGGNPLSIPEPTLFDGSVNLGFIDKYPLYRLFLIGVGVAVAVGLGLLQERTKMGAIVRAGVDDEEMVRGLGINVPLVFIAVFGLGAFLAAVGGIMGTAIASVGPGTDFRILVFAFAVVIVGGLGSLRGALVGALIVGLSFNYGTAIVIKFPNELAPTMAQATIFAPVAIILALKPTGLFGRT